MDTTEKENDGQEIIEEQMSVPGYGKPEASDYPNINNMKDNVMDENARYSREDLNVCETINNGYMFYVLGNAVFAKDISGYFYKLDKSKKEFEWFSDGWLEDNEFSIGVILPSPPTYISFNKDGLPVFPMNDDKPGKPILPRTENGEKIFPVDEKTKEPLFPLDFHGEPCFPVDDNGKPIFPKREDGRALVPIDSNGVAVFPRDINGKVIFPEGPNGQPIPPCTIYGNAIVPFKENGEPDLPVDSRGNPLIYLGGDDGMTPMTEEEYQQWQCTAAIYGQQTFSKDYYEEMAQNEQILEAYRNSYYDQYYSPSQDSNNPPLQPPVTQVEKVVVEKSEAEIEKEKKRKLLAMQMKSFKKAKGMTVENRESTPNDEKKNSSTPAAAVPINRPALPNKEKERGERYIPESITRRRRENSTERRYVSNRDDNRSAWRGNGRNDYQRNERSGSNYRNGRNTYRRRSRSKSRSKSRSRSKSNSESPYRLRRERSPSRSRVRRRRSSTRSRSRSATYSDDERTVRRGRARSSSSDASSSDGNDSRRNRQRKDNKSKNDRKRKRLESSSSDVTVINNMENEMERREIVKENEVEDVMVIDEVIKSFRDNENTQSQNEMDENINSLKFEKHVLEVENRVMKMENLRLTEENMEFRKNRDYGQFSFEKQIQKMEDMQKQMNEDKKSMREIIEKEVEAKLLLGRLKEEKHVYLERIKKLEGEVEEYQKIVKIKDEEYAKYKREAGYMLIDENERISRICREERESIMKCTMVAVEAKFAPMLYQVKHQNHHNSELNTTSSPRIFERKINEILEKATETMNATSMERSLAERCRRDCDEILRLIERSYNLRNLLNLPTNQQGKESSSHLSEVEKDTK